MSDILIAIKRSKWERDLMRYISPEAVRELYRIQNDAFDKVYASHSRQHESLELIKKSLPDATYAFREDLPHLDYHRFRYIMSVGGDNHFIHISHYADDSHYIFGVNSDTATSSGALLQFDAESFAKSVDGKLEEDRLEIEEWTRIDGELIYPDGRRTMTVPCTSEISIRNSYPDTMSRYIIRPEGRDWEEQKSSGLLLSTGAGSTGWFKNCLHGEERTQAIFPKDADFFKFLAREPGSRKYYNYTLGMISQGSYLELISEMEGEITIDANPDRTFDFPPGCSARFFLSKSKLKVVKSFRQ